MHVTVYGTSKRRRHYMIVYGSEGVRKYFTTSTAEAVKSYIAESKITNQVIKGGEIAQKILERGVNDA